jgi:SAM-dependent methyltransferase
MRSLIDHGLIETWIAETSRRGFYLEHKPLLTHSYRNWTLEQFKDAALFFLDWWLYLYNNGFSLQDCHCLNVMFDNYQPKFVDFCSIGPKEATTVSPPFMREFFDSWIAPLAVIRTNQHQLYRELMSNRISFELSKSLCNETVASELQELYARGETFFANKDVAGFLQVMKKWVEAVQVKHSDYGWNSEDYQRAILTESQPKTRKELIVAELLDEYSPRSFLDLGCNKGRFSLLALQKGAEVVALDMAESLLDKLYRFARHTRKPLTCLYWDLSRLSCFTKPERKFDMVAYLALVHHLVFSAAMTVEEIVEQADSLCEHVLLFEYIKPDKKEPYVYKNYVEEKHPHYSLEGFRALLENRFDVVRAVDISSTRVLFVATR